MYQILYKVDSYFFLFFTEIGQTSTWQPFSQFQDPKLQQLLADIPSFLQQSKRPATISAYKSSYGQFETWTKGFTELRAFPTDEYTVGLYIMHLVQEQKSVSTMKQFIASSSWLHHLGSYPDPTKTPVVDSLLQSAYRQLAQPVTHKNPLSKPVLQDIHDSMFASSNDYNLKISEILLT